MAGRLEGQVALVTGGGSGIGLAVVERYVQEGARVGVLQRSPGPAQALRERFGAGVVRVVEGDVRSAADQRRAVAETAAAFGGLDALVCNAGVWDYGRALARYDDEALVATYRELLDVNVLGCLLAVAAAREALQASRGAVILTGSPSGRFAGGGGPLYVASKHAVEGLVRQLAFELAPEVRVNAVAPGATRTALRGPAALGLGERRLDEQEELTGAIARQLPLGAVAEPADHASLYVLLAARGESGFMTAAVLRSDGGVEVRGGGAARAAAAGAAR